MYYFIVNPSAKSGRGYKIWKGIQRILRDKQIHYKAFCTEEKGHAGILARQAAEEGGKGTVIVAMGGDGTISEVMEGLWDHPEITFGYIPLGSGNDFARGLGISNNWKRALKGILRVEHQCLLYPGRMEFNGRTLRFGGSMGVGFDAAVCKTAEELKLKNVLNRIGLGKFIYLAAAVKHIFTMPCSPMKIRLDGRKVYTFQNVFFICGLNGKYEGGGFMFTPDGQIGDRYLNLCLVDCASPLKRLLILPRALVGKHVGAKGIHIFRCQRAEIISPLPRLIHGDGEVYGSVLRTTVELEKTGIPMIY